jgi:pyruvate formate lyase activating enzyme
MFQQSLENGAVRCRLCAHLCVVRKGKRGICKVRENRNGSLVSLSYGMLTSLAVDPIEKKPLFHYLPGSECMSVATAGCNLKCPWCQNHSLSRLDGRSPRIPGQCVEPSEIVARAVASGVSSLSYTYSEPTIFYEYARKIGVLARREGLGNNFVTNGHMTPDAVRDAADAFLDAANVDLKASNPAVYKRFCKGRLSAVKETIGLMCELGIWVEVTTLVIPTLNDGDEELGDIARFLASLDPGIPWHVSRFHPDLDFHHVPPTPMATLERAYEIGRAEGLKFIYIGNAWGSGAESTICPQCGAVVMSRFGFSSDLSGLADGLCRSCGHPIAGVFA